MGLSIRECDLLQRLVIIINVMIVCMLIGSFYNEYQYAKEFIGDSDSRTFEIADSFNKISSEGSCVKVTLSLKGLKEEKLSCTKFTDQEPETVYLNYLESVEVYNDLQSFSRLIAIVNMFISLLVGLRDLKKTLYRRRVFMYNFWIMVIWQLYSSDSLLITRSDNLLECVIFSLVVMFMFTKPRIKRNSQSSRNFKDNFQESKFYKN